MMYMRSEHDGKMSTSSLHLLRSIFERGVGNLGKSKVHVLCKCIVFYCLNWENILCL